MLKNRKIDVPAFEANSFGLQQESLLQTKFTGQGDAASRAEHSLPGQARHEVQYLRHVTRTAGIPCGFGNGTVGTDFSAGNPANGGGDGNGERRVGCGLALRIHDNRHTIRYTHVCHEFRSD